MNSLVLKYILTIAEEKNMTRAAERLYISQPSLSQSLKNLEKELGVDLFERSRQGVVLTPAGEHYVEWAKQILFAEAMMKRKIQDISAKNVRQIKFGTTPQRTSYILDFVVNQFQKEYANYKIFLEDRPSTELYELLDRGSLDFIIDTTNFVSLSFRSIPLIRENLLLAVPGAVRLPAEIKSGYCYPVVDLAYAKDQPFCLMPEDTSLGRYSLTLCKKAGFVPDMRFQCRRQATAHLMVHKGFAATFVNELMVLLGGASPDVNYYYITPDFPSIELSLIYRSDYTPLETDRQFVEQIKAFFSEKIAHAFK